VNLTLINSLRGNHAVKRLPGGTGAIGTTDLSERSDAATTRTESKEIVELAHAAIEPHADNASNFSGALN
jgi:hypothetical protein